MLGDRSRLTLCLLAVGLSAMLGGCAPVPTPFPLTPAPTLEITPSAVALPELLALPAAFRYVVTLRPADSIDEPATVIAGQYRAEAWAQSTQRGDETPEELVVAQDASTGEWHSYTRSASSPEWTRWPGIGFDAGFGLASPFTILRLFTLADHSTPGEEVALSGVAEKTVEVQAVFAPATIERLLKSGAAAVAANDEERSALEEQLSGLLTPQVLTYWVGTSGRIYQAAGTLMAAEPHSDTARAPWLEGAWRFFDYEDAQIAIAAPLAATDAADLATAAGAPEAATQLDPATTLRLRVFANPGVPADNVSVLVYPAGKSQSVAGQAGADAQFALPAGTYDVLVRSGNAQQMLKGVAVVKGDVASRDVLFNFGALQLTILLSGDTPALDVVVYPAGQRQTWVDYRNENPTTIRLPAGLYDVEIALPDFRGTKTLNGIEVKPGETTAQTVDLGQ